jgi:hypothetical protein
MDERVFARPFHAAAGAEAWRVATTPAPQGV